MPIRKNKSGIEVVHVENLPTLTVNVDDLEALTTAGNAHHVDNKAHLASIKAEIQYANNHLTTNAVAHSLLAGNAHHVDNKAHLASVKAEIQYANNTGASGSLAHSLLAGNVNTAHISDNLDTISGNLGTIDSVLDDILVKNTQIDTVLDTSKVVLDNQLTKLNDIDEDTGNILTKATEIDTVLDASLVKHTANETLLTQLDVVADASLVKHTNNETLLTQLDVVADASLVKHTNNETLLTSIDQKLGDIETAVQILDNAISGTEMQVDVITMPTTTVTGTVTANLSATDNAVLDAIETTSNAIQSAVEGTLTVGSHAVTNAGTFAVQAVCSGTVTANLGATDNAVLDDIAQKLGDIETAVQVLDNAISGTEMQVDVITMPTTTVTGTVTANLSATDNAVLDAIETTSNAIQSAVEGTLTVGSHAVTNAGTFAVQAVCSGTVTANLGATDNAVLDDIAQKLGDIETAVQVLDNAISGTEMQVDVITMPTTTVTGTVTANLSATDNAVLDAIETTNNAIQSAVEGTLTVGSHAVTNAGTFAVQAVCSGTVTANLGATDNAVLDDIAQKLGDIETAVQVLDNAISGNEMQVDVISMPTTTVSGTVTANLSATDNAVLDAMATDLAALEVLQTTTNSKIDTFDAVLDASLVKQTGMATDLEALEVLNTSILAKIQPTRDVVTIFNNTSLGADATITSGEVDMLNFRHIRIVGFSDEDDKSGQIQIWGATSSGGTYFNMGFSSASYSSSAILVPTIENIPVRYIKLVITDQTGGSSNIILYGFRLN